MSYEELIKMMKKARTVEEIDRVLPLAEQFASEHPEHRNNVLDCGEMLHMTRESIELFGETPEGRFTFPPLIP